MSYQESPSSAGSARNEYGFEHWYQRYRNWVLANESSMKKYAIISIIVSLLLVLIAVFVPMPQFLRTITSFPAGILAFLVPLGLSLLKTSHEPEKLTLRERIATSRRRRLAILGSVALVIVLLTAGTILPYAVGGVLTVAGALGLYNFARRTPEEIALAEAGLPDPREPVVIDDNESADTNDNVNKKEN